MKALLVFGKVAVKNGIAFLAFALIGDAKNREPLILGSTNAKKAVGAGLVFVD